MPGSVFEVFQFYTENIWYKKNISETGRSNKKAQATLGTKHRTQTNKTKTRIGMTIAH
jgi:hypothetical protein